ncbi:hypothetical protein [Polaribacter porphyrae]|uniref:Uncharacterized protein n=1 Tax=Polaribacter porphyrae TaxID=1137780 RepID=A0A2S7WQG1_9FLAO|nr:hypothetical protein [Polaribacter porphyrae]PQJ79855.1 hypothetical protein BTO18_12010 [Polaribacter porphyrae]
MEKKYEITEKQQAFLEDYIKRKKRFSNPEDLNELIDHLVTDFEHTGNGNISKYLADNSSFIFNFQGSSKNLETSIHWKYQRELWQIFLRFFYKLKYLPYTFFTIFCLYNFFFHLHLQPKTLGFIIISILVILMIISFVLTYHKSKRIRKLTSFKHLFNVMSLPNLTLYAFTSLADFFKENKLLFLIYALIAFGLYISGILLIKNKRKQILEKHKHLLN